MSRTLSLAVVLTAMLLPLHAAHARDAHWSEALPALSAQHAAGQLDDEAYAAALLQVARAPHGILAGDPTATRCTTSLMRRAWHVARDLGPDAQARLAAGGLARPGGVVGSVCPSDVNEPQVCVHYLTAGQAALAQAVYDLAVQAWQAEVDTMGFDPPHPDDDVEVGPEVDIYLSPANGGAFTAPEASAAAGGTAHNDSSAWIVIDDLITESLLGSFVAHELHHAIQFAYDVDEHDNAYEATSVFIEDQVFDDLDDYTRFINTFQAAPDRALDWFPGFQSPDLFYIYGSAAFLMYASEAHDGGGVALVRSMWEQSIQTGTANEPDYYDALDSLLPGGMDNGYGEFAAWRSFTGANSVPGYFSEGASWNSVPPNANYGIGQLPAMGGTTSGCAGCVAPQEYGANYITIDTSGAVEGDRLEFDLSGDPAADWSLSLAGVPGGAETDPCLSRTQANNGGARLYVDSLNLYDRIVIAVANLGSGARDPDDSNYLPSDFDFELTYSSDGSGATDGIPGCKGSSDPVGCGCYLTTRPPSPPALAVALALLAGTIIVRRRRR